MTLEFQSRPIERAAESAASRRGPLRPARLVSVRQREGRRLAGHRFRAVDALFLAGAVALFMQHAFDGAVLLAPLAEVIPVVAGAWSVWTLVGAFGLYRFGRTEHVVVHLGLVWVATVAGGLVAALAHTVLPAEQTDAGDTVLTIAFCGIGLSIMHAIRSWRVARWRSIGLLTPNVVVVGATRHAEELIAEALDRRDMNILGVFDDRLERSPLAMLGVPMLGTTEAMLRHRIMPYVDLIVVTIDPSAVARVRQITERLAVLPNTVTLLFDESIASRRARAIDQITDAPLHPVADPARKAFAKRVQDLTIGVASLILFAPLMVVVALAIRLDSAGPVFFRQRRHGFTNEEIFVWKFRTMRHEDADPTATRQVTADDDRVTRVGRVLRKTSIDELPQLFNVIAGQMSLVGPRPHAIGMKTGDVESAELVAEYAHRHRIKPGMTGWAAVNGSRGPLHEPEDVCRRVALDISYIERQSFWLDVQIMAKTIPSMLGDRGAVR